ncbi:MAG: hypothetical protein MUF87_22045 [Anaerolineae bacterium]|nr:hypothetical protein [Anaerolineae bacterium]
MSRRYTPETRAKALAMLRDHGNNVGAVSLILKIPERTLRDWRAQESREQFLNTELKPYDPPNHVAAVAEKNFSQSLPSLPPDYQGEIKFVRQGVMSMVKALILRQIDPRKLRRTQRVPLHLGRPRRERTRHPLLGASHHRLSGHVRRRHGLDSARQKPSTKPHSIVIQIGYNLRYLHNVD